MTSIAKPPVRHPALKTNALGLTPRDYEGAMSTLCAGCGHDSVTAALVQSMWELAIPPHRAAKMSGIGCSSKTTAYFMKQSHGFNSVHGRMPSVASGANAANRALIVARREPERIGLERRMTNGGFGDRRHAGTCCTWV
jgi:2-oxoglutarate ferredoxin oxidoreductase subunit beta